MMMVALEVANMAAHILHLAENNYRTVAGVSFAVFLMLRVALGKLGGVYWYSFVHAILLSIAGVLCFYLDFYSTEIDGTPEPLRTVQCGGALTPLHTLLPMVSLGYSLIDFFDGVIERRVDFMVHGFSLGAVMLAVCELKVPHTVASLLIMEISSVPLNLLKVKWTRPILGHLNGVAFVTTFFFSRIVAVPWLWSRWLRVFYGVVAIGGSSPCYPFYFFYVVLAFGAIFHTLNVYWFWIIVKGFQKRIFGPEKKADKGAMKAA